MIPGLVAHLWQSTLFAGTAWLLTLALRKNKAQVRYRIWFIASAKFLVPFSLLVGLGTLVPRREAAPSVQTGWASAAEQFGQPLFSIPAVAARVAVTSGRTNHNYFAAAALTLWACGLVIIAICWLVRWNRVRALRRSAKPAIIPCSVELAVPVMSVPGLVEPGIFGIFRPVLLLPEGIQEQLDRAQLDAILAHELCHVHRRDNLTAAIHMVVQATFWFHPLAWWLGARLVDERERACDEEVLRLGSKPQVYATGILRVCRRYVGAPLVCVSGVTGANLKKRIEAIMRNQVALRLNFTRKAALAVVAIVAFVLPIMVGILKTPSVRAQAQTEAAPLRFEVASVKPTSGVLPDGRLVVGMLAPTGGPGTSDPGRIRYPAVNLKTLVLQAFDVEDADLHGPDWLDNQFFEVNAVMPAETTPEQFRVMLLNLLAERFKLTVHREVKESSGYNLVVAKNGPKMTESQGDMPPLDEKWVPKVGKDGFMVPRSGQQLFVESGRLRSRWTFQHISAQQLTGYLETLTGSSITNGTGLTGRYDLSLTFRTAGTSLEKGPGLGRPDWSTAPADISVADAIPDIFGAVQLLGLKLEPKRHAKETIMVDHIDKLPTAN